MLSQATTKPNQSKTGLRKNPIVSSKSRSSCKILFIYWSIYAKIQDRALFSLWILKLLTSSEAPKRRTSEIGIQNCVFTVCGLCKGWQLTKQLQFWIFLFTHIFFNVIREQSRTPTWLQLLLSHCDPKGLEFYGTLCSWWLRLLEVEISQKDLLHSFHCVISAKLKQCFM